MSQATHQTAWLVDVENVHSHWVNVLPLIKEKDYVCLFYSQNADQISIPLIFALYKKKAHLDASLCEAGAKKSSALDFQLCTELGRMVEKYKKSVSYRIISNDAGYDVVVENLARQGYSVKRVAAHAKTADSLRNLGDMEKGRELLALYRQACLGLRMPEEEAELCARAMYEAFSHKKMRIIWLRGWMEKHLEESKWAALEEKAQEFCRNQLVP